MDPRFQHHNLFKRSSDEFDLYDPYLRQLIDLPFIYHSPLLNAIHITTPGIYTLTGGRQVGKSTFLKQFIRSLLREKVPKENIYFISCELVNDYIDLTRIVETTLEEMNPDVLNYIIVDEVTYISQWDRSIKHLADTGQLINTFLIVSGSDAIIIRHVMSRFPGRRGKAPDVDFHLYPLSFEEFVKLRRSVPEHWIRDIRNGDFDFIASLMEPDLVDLLFDEFEIYCTTGGYLTAINDLDVNDTILPSTFRTYSDWIRGDILRHGKSEIYLLEILGAILQRYGSQLTWNALSTELSIDHPATVSDYVHLLESMDAVFIQPALLEHKLLAAPKKAKKIYFSDPFIFHSIDAWISGVRDPYHERVRSFLANPEQSSTLVEGIAVNHFRRTLPTFYIKGKGEIDVAAIQGRRIMPVEVKWRKQIRKKDLKELLRFPNGIIATRYKTITTLSGRLAIPLPVLLLRELSI